MTSSCAPVFALRAGEASSATNHRTGAASAAAARAGRGVRRGAFIGALLRRCGTTDDADARCGARPASASTGTHRVLLQQDPLSFCRRTLGGPLGQYRRAMPAERRDRALDLVPAVFVTVVTAVLATRRGAFFG